MSKLIQLSIFDNGSNHVDFESNCQDMTLESIDKIFDYYNSLNADDSHSTSRDDICTPMECVKTMIDYIPNELWERDKIRILDPCCGNGNFGAYCKFKTSLDNIWFNDLNSKRVSNCKKILNPKHISCQNAFRMSGDFDGKWDMIMANPPYSGGGNKNRSLSNEFIELAINLLNDNGYLCFITPNNWMTYNNDNTTIKALLTEGSFIVIDNDAKKYFPSVGSSFSIIVWQKHVFNNRTKVINNYLIRDIQENVVIQPNLKFIPLYISQSILSIVEKTIQPAENLFKYRCDLHNFTKKDFLSDTKNEIYQYETIHTPRKTRYAKIKQDIYDKWIIVVPLSTYYVPYIRKNVNTTQSVGYFAFDTKKQAEKYLSNISQACYKVIIHLTRYGNFNNIMVLKHLRFDSSIDFTEEELNEILRLTKLIKY